jgi:hypothetical protein
MAPIPVLPGATPVGSLSAHLRPSQSAVRYAIACRLELQQDRTSLSPIGRARTAEGTGGRIGALLRRRSRRESLGVQAAGVRVLSLKVRPRRLPARNAGVRVSLVSTILPWLPSTSHAVENRIRCGSSFVAYTLEGAPRSPFSHRTYTAGYPNQRRARIHCARKEHARTLRECGGRTLWGALQAMSSLEPGSSAGWT